VLERGSRLYRKPHDRGIARVLHHSLERPYEFDLYVLIVLERAVKDSAAIARERIIKYAIQLLAA
jgi:hypothetical protein